MNNKMILNKTRVLMKINYQINQMRKMIKMNKIHQIKMIKMIMRINKVLMNSRKNPWRQRIMPSNK